MKKVLAILLAGMMTATAFAGCGGGNASSNGGSSNGSGGSGGSASGGKVDEKMFGDETNIELKVWAPDKGVSLAKEQIETFKKMYPNIKFKKIVEPGDEPTFVFTKLVFDETQLSVQVSIEDEETQYVKMSLLYHHSDI